MVASGSAESQSPQLQRTVERCDPVGDDLVFSILADLEEDERLSALLGVDLGPAAPDPAHAPQVLPDLASWLRRAEEVYAFLQAASASERGRRPA